MTSPLVFPHFSYGTCYSEVLLSQKHLPSTGDISHTSGRFLISGMLGVFQWLLSYFQCHFHLWHLANFHNVPSLSNQCASLLFCFFLAWNEFHIFLWKLSVFSLWGMFRKALYVSYQKPSPACQLWTHGYLDSSDLLFSMPETVGSKSELQGTLVICPPEKCGLESSQYWLCKWHHKKGGSLVLLIPSGFLMGSPVHYPHRSSKQSMTSIASALHGNFFLLEACQGLYTSLYF